ncbi:auxin response factor 2-like isoform X3 [Elaeis guineensis]|uniref:auxin response factor 2-like isoform X3 n=1 Tax=Elaeis guineensis var. tenera TaxID=51953 RepID=UPI003C6D8898
MGIDLNTVEEEEEEEAELPAAVQVPSQAQHRPSPATAGAETLCLELWHACVGSLTSLRRKGSVVVYLPQGHLEHLGDAGGSGGSSNTTCRLTSSAASLTSSSIYRRGLCAALSGRRKRGGRS